MKDITLERGFVVKQPKDLAIHGLNIPNPKEKGYRGESNWPKIGLSFGRGTFFDYAQEVASNFPGNIPVAARITFNPNDDLETIRIFGVRRDGYGGIDCYRCNNLMDVLRSFEFIIPRQRLAVSKVGVLKPQITFDGVNYVELKQITSTQKPDVKDILRRILPG